MARCSPILLLLLVGPHAALGVIVCSSPDECAYPGCSGRGCNSTSTFCKSSVWQHFCSRGWATDNLMAGRCGHYVLLDLSAQASSLPANITDMTVVQTHYCPDALPCPAGERLDLQTLFLAYLTHGRPA